MLKTTNLYCGYNNVAVLRDVTLTVPPKTVTGLVGLNGAGKTTLLKTLAGVIPAIHGDAFLDNTNVTSLSTQSRLKHGIALVPEGRELFNSMTVEENLKVSFLKTNGNIHNKLYYVYTLFPDLQRLKHKKASTLSGGQAQMVAISRALMSGGKTLLLDEVTMGLSQKLCSDVFSLITRLAPNLNGVLVTGQEVERILKVSHTVYGVKNGLVFNLDKNPETVKRMIY